jgi:hypothetical protein
MAVIKRQWRTWLAVVAVFGGVFLLWDREGAAHPGDLTINTERTFASLDGSADDHDGLANGVLTLHGDLLLDTGGSITCFDPALPTSAGACAINLLGDGSLEMKAGSAILAENRIDGGGGGDIFVTVGGDLTLRGPSSPGGTDGALISSRKLCLSGPCGSADGGDIRIVVGGVTLDTSVYPAVGQCNTPNGDVLIEKGAAIRSDSQLQRAGDIAIYAGRNITIDGEVTAQGLQGTTAEGGAITIDACCNLSIGDDGVVSSRGADFGADRVHLEACVVTIYGLVESTGVAHTAPKPLCTPPLRPGKPTTATVCVEIWSGTTVTIDSTGTHKGEVNADTAIPSGGTTGLGWIDVISNLNVVLQDGAGNDHVQPLGGGGSVPVNHMLHANQYLGNGHGGLVEVFSKTGSVSASGNAISANAVVFAGDGGDVTVEAAGNVALDASSIEARGDDHSNGFGGSISARSYAGDVTGAPPGLLDASAFATGNFGSVTLTACANPVGYTGGSNPAAVPNPGVCIPTMPTLPALAAPEAYPSGDCVQYCSPPTPTPTPTNTPTTPTVTPTPSIFCTKQPVLTQLNGKVPDIIVRTDLGQPIQAAVDGVTDSNNDGYLIVGVVNNGSGALGGHVYNQSVVVSQAYDKPFWLIGCSVTLHDPTPGDGNAVIQIAASASSPGPYNIFLMDLHAADSAQAGIESTGDGRYLRNENVLSNAFGFKVTGNNNTIHNGSATSNGVGVWISGDGNTATDTNAYSNTSHGFQVIGDSNRLLKLDSGDSGKGNGGDGFNVAGDSNLLSEDDAFANAGNGFVVVGNSNSIFKGRSGDSGKGNGTVATQGDGYNVAGFGNAFQESRASANKGDGWDVSGGVMGSPNKFKSILSNTGSSGSATLENAGSEFRLVGYVLNNGGGNKADNVAIPKTTAPVKCNLFPATNATANVNFSCGD